MKNRRGFIGDIPLLIGVLFLVAVLIIVGYHFYTSFNDQYQASDADAQSKALLQTNKDRYVSLFDGIFGFVFALLMIALFISVTQIPSNPAFFFITVILIVVLIGGAAIFSNAYEDISTDTNINSTSSEFTFVPYLMGNLPIVVLFMGVIFMIGLYMKLRGVF